VLGRRPAGLPAMEWTELQRRLARADSWIMDGDLGPFDVLDVGLRRADTVLLLDFPLLRCAYRAVRRSREGREFWRWVWSYRRRWRPLITAAVAVHAPNAEVIVLRDPAAVARFLARAGS
jgi:hypothetical protein